jgi:polyribonucleotide nucleotidyltransferase
MKEIKKEIKFGDRLLTLSTGKLAQQASGAVLAQYGETVVLATVVSAPLKADLGYFPLTVEYQERLYAGGRIKGSRWVKREGKATDEEILSARLIDRSIRPLFPDNYKKEVQVVVTVLSVDLENDPVVLGSIATSAALSISEIPWQGPIATTRVGLKEGEFVINPKNENGNQPELDLVVSSTLDAVVMIEAAALEVKEEKVASAIAFAKSENKKLIELISDLAKEAGKEKEEFPKETIETSLKDKVKKIVDKSLEKTLTDLAIHEGGDSVMNELKKAVSEELPEEDPIKVASVLDSLLKEKAREIILKGRRFDGRKFSEIRKLEAEVGVLPRTHGSGLFQRGQTQVLTIATLGARSLGQTLETAEGEETKHFIHHYSMPPYATGEAGKMGGPSRREIGHGALAERALLPVIPSEEVFPYAIRLVSEVMSSNGSTSMASTCGSTLALMDAGVPIKAPVSGIAMGVIVEGENHAILTDIIGLEDHLGDMDFKVAGTEKGITALQLDVKTLSLTEDILSEALIQAKEARMEILKIILNTIDSPRPKVSALAPKIEVVKIPVEMIGELIGPSGRNIKKLILDTAAQIEVEDSGLVYISSVSDEAVSKAKAYLENMIKAPVPGEIYHGKVKKIMDFGAFVEILPGKEGLVHVSDMAEEFVKDPREKVSEGADVTVRVKEIDQQGRLNLSMLLDPASDKDKPQRSQRPQRGNFERGGSNGPHFPASRFVRSQRPPGGSRGQGDKRRFGR